VAGACHLGRWLLWRWRRMAVSSADATAMTQPSEVVQSPVDQIDELATWLQVLVGLSRAIRCAQSKLPKSGEFFMAIDPTLSAALDAVDKATNDVAAELKDLSTQISTGMTTQDVADVVARLNKSSQFLETVAADPSQPVVGEAPSPS
jgi:hypothetical protein